MRYLARTIYVVRNAYPTITSDHAAIIREARRSDVGRTQLGCMSEGRVVPLSPAEVEIVRQRYVEVRS